MFVEAKTFVSLGSRNPACGLDFLYMRVFVPVIEIQWVQDVRIDDLGSDEEDSWSAWNVVSLAVFHVDDEVFFDIGDAGIVRRTASQYA